MIGIPRNKTSFLEMIKNLEKVGYEHREQADATERIFFRKDLPDSNKKIRRYHIHVTYKNNKDWEEILAFRDTLRANPQLIIAYEKLKSEMVVSNPWIWGICP